MCLQNFVIGVKMSTIQEIVQAWQNKYSKCDKAVELRDLIMIQYVNDLAQCDR